MRALFFMKLLAVLSIAVAIGCSVVSSSSKSVDLKELIPETAPETAAKGTQTAVFAGGCFWGVEAVFEHVKGVTNVVSGYSGGDAKTATYDQVSDGDTGHAEAVKITFDQTKVTYQQLLFVFFSVAHDPTQLNFQGPDHGTQYRSAIFYTGEDQRKPPRHSSPPSKAPRPTDQRSSPRSSRSKPFTTPNPIIRTTSSGTPTNRTSSLTTNPRSQHLRNSFPSCGSRNRTESGTEYGHSCPDRRFLRREVSRVFRPEADLSRTRVSVLRKPEPAA